MSVHSLLHSFVLFVVVDSLSAATCCLYMSTVSHRDQHLSTSSRSVCLFFRKSLARGHTRAARSLIASQIHRIALHRTARCPLICIIVLVCRRVAASLSPACTLPSISPSRLNIPPRLPPTDGVCPPGCDVYPEAAPRSGSVLFSSLYNPAAPFPLIYLHRMNSDGVGEGITSHK